MDIKGIYEKFRSGVEINESAKSIKSAPAPKRNSIEEAIHLMNNESNSTRHITESVRSRSAKKVMESRNIVSGSRNIKESSKMIDYKGSRIFNLGDYFVVNSVASNPESWMLNSEGKAVPDEEETEFKTLADAKAAVDKFAKSVNESAGDNRFKQNKRVRPKNIKESSEATDYEGCRIFKLGDYFVVNSDASNPESDMLNDLGNAVSDGKEKEFNTQQEAKLAIDLYKKGEAEYKGALIHRVNDYLVVASNTTDAEAPFLNASGDEVEDGKEAEFKSLSQAVSAIEKSKGIKESARESFMNNRRVRPKNIKESSDTTDYKGCRIFKLGDYFVVNSDAKNPESWMLNSEGKAVPDEEETEFKTLADAKAAVDKFAKSVNESKKVPKARPRLLEAEGDADDTEFSIEDASLIGDDLVLTVENSNGESVAITLKNVDFESGDIVYEVAPTEDDSEDDSDAEFDEDDNIEESSKK